jgi:hypothetical protein
MSNLLMEAMIKYHAVSSGVASCNDAGAFTTLRKGVRNDPDI